jgi:hypothetical protein
MKKLCGSSNSSVSINNQMENDKNNNINYMYQRTLDTWKEMEEAKEEKVNVEHNEIINDHADDADKYIRVKISCDFSKRDHIKRNYNYSNNCNINHHQDNNKNNKRLNNKVKRNKMANRSSLFQGWTKTDHNYFIYGAIDGEDLIQNIEEQKQKELLSNKTSVQINNINDTRNKLLAAGHDGQDVCLEENSMNNNENYSYSSNEEMEKIMNAKIKHKPVKKIAPSFSERFSSKMKVNTNNDHQSHHKNDADKRFVSPYLQYLIGRSDRNSRRRGIGHRKNNRNNNNLLKSEDGSVLSISTLENVLDIRKTRDHSRNISTIMLHHSPSSSLQQNKECDGDDCHLPMIGLASTNLNAIHNQKDQTYSLLSKLDARSSKYNNNQKGNSIDLLVPSKPMLAYNGGKTNDIRRGLYHESSNSISSTSKKDSNDKSHVKKKELKYQQSKRVKRVTNNKTSSFTPVMPRPKPCTIGEMPKLFTYQRMGRKEKKAASLFPSFVKEKFKLPENSFRIQYYFKKHHRRIHNNESKIDFN